MARSLSARGLRLHRDKQLLFGGLHCMGKDGFMFYTETKNVTTTWFTGKEIPVKVSTWDGTMTRG